jgi:O-antigen/teichoic acid export membrane protein
MSQLNTEFFFLIRSRRMDRWCICVNEIDVGLQSHPIAMLIRLQSSGFMRNFSILVTGTAIAQAIPVLLQPLLRRMFDADVFALFAVYNSITSILIVVTTLRYEMAIVLPEKDRDAMHLVLLSLVINLAFSTLFFVVLALFPSSIAQWIRWPAGETGWLLIIPVAVFLFSAGQTLNYWLIRKKAFKASATNRVFRRLSEGAFQTGGGAFRWQGSLLWGDLLGRLVNLTVAWIQSVKAGFSWKGLTAGEMKTQAIRYKDFPLFQAVPAVLNTISLMLPVLLVNSYYTANATAQFDLCRQVLVLPLALITTAMSQVLLQKFAEQRNLGQRILPGFLKSSLYTLLAAAGIVLFFLLTGRPLFAFLFGEQWGEAGVYAAILAPAFMIQFVVSPVSTIIVALEKVRIGAVWQVLYFGGILSLSFFRHLPEKDFFLVFTLMNLGAYTVYWLIILVITLRYEQSISFHAKKP